MSTTDMGRKVGSVREQGQGYMSDKKFSIADEIDSATREKTFALSRSEPGNSCDNRRNEEVSGGRPTFKAPLKVD